jgi:hypothetical protein
MQDISITNGFPPEVFAVLATGESVRLMKDGTEFAVITPTCGVGEQRQEFIEWANGRRATYEIEKYELTKEEVDSWRDRSIGRVAPFAE